MTMTRDEIRHEQAVRRWRDMIQAVAGRYEVERWKLADLIHRGVYQLDLSYDEIEEVLNTPRGSLYNKVSMVNHYPPERRKWALSWSHYAAVQALPPEYQDTLMDWAVAQHAGYRALQEASRDAQRLLAPPHGALKSDPLPDGVPTRYVFTSALELDGEFGLRLKADRVLSTALSGRPCKVTLEFI